LWTLKDEEMKQLKAKIQIYFKLDDLQLTFKLKSWNIEKNLFKFLS
jgi:hypothetical protein